MHRGFLPFLFLYTHAAGRLLGRDGASVAALAVKAILSHRKTLEVAHQQIRFRGHDFAFSSRITAQGELVVELDVGDPRLGERIVLEEELRTARCAASPTRRGARSTRPATGRTAELRCTCANSTARIGMRGRAGGAKLPA